MRSGRNLYSKEGEREEEIEKFNKEKVKEQC